MPTNRPAPADNHDVERAEAALSSATISIHHMLQAWNDAGLSHALVPSAIQRVNLLRPTLLGRADPVLELQLQTEAAKAARELADSTVIVLAGASTHGAVAAARYFVEQCKFRRGWFAAVVSSQVRDDHVCPPETVRIERLARPGAKP